MGSWGRLRGVAVKGIDEDDEGRRQPVNHLVTPGVRPVHHLVTASRRNRASGELNSDGLSWAFRYSSVSTAR